MMASHFSESHVDRFSHTVLIIFRAARIGSVIANLRALKIARAYSFILSQVSCKKVDTLLQTFFSHCVILPQFLMTRMTAIIAPMIPAMIPMIGRNAAASGAAIAVIKGIIAAMPEMTGVNAPTIVMIPPTPLTMPPIAIRSGAATATIAPIMAMTFLVLGERLLNLSTNC